ncbi:MAG: endonuclease III [Bacilli bacterium]|nr:endonuclease III [Bacilli bacterium]
MNLSDRAIIIQKYFDEILPNPGCELTYTTDYGFLISVMLSAQTTDKKVNKVTDVLFSKYPTLQDLENADINDIEAIIRPLGLSKTKAKNVKAIVHSLLIDFNGVVPKTKEELMKLPGVGNKTSNVVLIELFKVPAFPVDTHVFRTSKRLNLASEEDDVLEVETKLKKIFPKENWIKLHHQFIHFGRYYCKAISPKCDDCKLKGICKKYEN